MAASAKLYLGGAEHRQPGSAFSFSNKSLNNCECWLADLPGGRRPIYAPHCHQRLRHSLVAKGPNDGLLNRCRQSTPPSSQCGSYARALLAPKPCFGPAVLDAALDYLLNFSG